MMSPVPVNTMRVARAAARRSAAGELIRAGGFWLCVGGGVALALVGADKTLGGNIRWEWSVGAPVAAAVVGAALEAYFRRWSAAKGARELDRRLGLRDALATGLAMAQAGGDAFATWAVADAERAAATVKVSDAIPVRAGRSWGLWPALVAGAVAVAMFVPPVRWNAARRPPAVTPQERAAAVQQMGDVASSVKAGLDQAAVKEATQDQLRLLDEVQKELESGQVSPKDANARAASAMEEIARRMDADARTQERAADQVREDLTRAAKSDHRPGEASGIADAIQRGDLEAASRAAEDAARTADRMTREQREQVARELDSLSRALQEQPSGGGQPARQQPGSRTIPEAEPGGSEQGTTGAAPESDSQKEVQARQQKAAREAAERKRQELERGLRDAAKELRGEKPESRPESRDEPGSNREQSQPQEQRGANSPDNRQEGEREASDATGSPGRTGQSGATGESGETGSSGASGPRNQEDGREPEHQSEPSGARNHGEQGQEGSTGKPQRQGESSHSQREQPGGGQREPGQGQGGVSGSTGSTSATGSTGGSGAPGATGQAGSTGSQGASGTSGATDAGGSSGAMAPSGRSGSTGAGPTEGEQQGQQAPSIEEQGQSPDGASPNGVSPTALEGLARQLKSVAQGQKPPTREQADRLRQMADRMLQDMTPEQREQMKKLAKDFARQAQGAGQSPGPGPQMPGAEPAGGAARDNARTWRGESLPLDARRPAAARDRPQERTISQWSGPGQKEPGAPNSDPGLVQALREAAQGAEQAVEQQQVPARYSDLVRRVFKRYSEGTGQK